MPDRKNLIQPITAAQQESVIEETTRYILSAADYFNTRFKTIPVLFDLRGRAAGMYRIKANQKVIRYNPFIFAKYFEDNFKETIPHEVAHYVTDELYGLRRIRPHGNEWKNVMQFFGVAANRTANYDLSGIPRRQHKTFLYHCSCQNYELTSRRHNKIKKGTGHYLCRSCGDKLLFVKSNQD
jgi:SprT protein